MKLDRIADEFDEDHLHPRSLSIGSTQRLVTGASHAMPVRGWQQDGDDALGSFQVSVLRIWERRHLGGCRQDAGVPRVAAQVFYELPGAAHDVAVCGGRRPGRLRRLQRFADQNHVINQ